MNRIYIIIIFMIISGCCKHDYRGIITDIEFIAVSGGLSRGYVKRLLTLDDKSKYVYSHYRYQPQIGDTMYWCNRDGGKISAIKEY